MPLDELDQKQFTRERVKNRMLKRAAELWGFPESQIDEFDPLVRLLIEACAVEFERTAGEIGKTQNRMLERLARLLYPGQIDVHPATAIMQARPAEATETLYPEDQFFYKNANERAGSGQLPDIFFTPSGPVLLFDAAIAIQATAREAVRLEEDQRPVMAAGSHKSVVYDNVLWLGIESGEEVKTLTGLSFFFQWFHMPETENWYAWLPYTEWLADGMPVSVAAGMPPGPGTGKHLDLEAAFDPLHGIERDINQVFQRNFIHLAGPDFPEMSRLKRRKYPEVFENLFSKKDLQEFKEPLIWLEVKFPPVVPAEAVNTVSCSLNSFPVINRRLNRVHYKLGPRLNILPLETTATFLAIKEITNSNGEPVKLIPFANPADLLPETYTLRYGINRFDERSTYEVLINLTDLIREESSYFSSLGEDFLSQHIRELNQVLARIESRLGNREKQASPYPYLAIRPVQEGGNVHIEFWSCDGAAANRITAGSRLIPYQNSSVVSDSLRLVTGSFGGKDKFTDAEKTDQYKKTLLTHDRIVTMEDLRRFVYAELGSNARNVQFQTTYLKGSGPREGFIRFMEISIDPKPGRLQEQEWKQFVTLLQHKLEQASAGHIPYRIKLNRSGNI